MPAEEKLKIIFLILVIVIVGGTVGYSLIEGWPFLDSLYMTIITLSTVGFKEVYPLSPEGRVFTIVLVIFGVMGAAYTASVFGRVIIEGELRRILGRRKMEKQLKDIKDHYLICGYGRVGRQICKEFKARGVPSVVVERDPTVVQEAINNGVLCMQGDSTEDSTLIAAGVQKAKGLIIAMGSEADSVFITLSARQLNPNLIITARAESDSAERKLKRAGADKVVSPHEIGGIRMALATLRPHIVDFMRITTFEKDTGLGIDEMEVKSESPLAGTVLKDSSIRSELGITVLAIKKVGEEIRFNPSPDTKIESGDILILLGRNEALEKLGKMTAV